MRERGKGEEEEGRELGRGERGGRWGRRGERGKGGRERERERREYYKLHSHAFLSLSHIPSSQTLFPGVCF